MNTRSLFVTSFAISTLALAACTVSTTGSSSTTSSTTGTTATTATTTGTGGAGGAGTGGSGVGGSGGGVGGVGGENTGGSGVGGGTPCDMTKTCADAITNGGAEMLCDGTPASDSFNTLSLCSCTNTCKAQCTDTFCKFNGTPPSDSCVMCLQDGATGCGNEINECNNN